ncbi:MAG: polysaccharide biosynthesis tyrosine autokinase [Candidatus Promineifilaceae bacterium]|nr:polysaccharide biosynthesis tyrosine autokinase [Candidatus Promineifilaceae bacterium]
MDQRYFNFIRRWWWLILLATVSAGVITYWISSQQPVNYEARTRLIIGPGIEGLKPDEKDFQTGGRLMQTYAELATTRTVLQTVIDNLGLDLTADDVERLLTVRPTTETQFLTIVVEDSDQRRATDIANALAEELVRLSPTGDNDSGAAVVREQMREQTSQIEENIANIQAGIEQLEIELENTEEIERQRVISDQIALERERLSSAHATLALLYDSLQQAITNQVQIVEAAIQAEPQPSQTELSVLMGAIAGLIIGVVIALTFEFIDDFTVRTSEHIENLTHLPTLAGIGEIKGEDKLVSITDPRSATAEAYRALRTSIQFSSVDTPSRSILVTSSIPGEGRSTTAANLAIVMAQAGHDVLLVDADLRRPSQQHLFNVPSSLGLTSLLLEFDATREEQETETLIDDLVQVTRVEGLQLLASGPIPPNPSELLGSTKMKTLMSKLVERYDFVILDSPAVLLATDAAVLSVHTDSTLLVAWAGKSRKVNLQEAAEQLREVNANLMGCVLNGISVKDVRARYYHDERAAYETTDHAQANGRGTILSSVSRFDIKKKLGIGTSADN